jgi:hypothetical protein
VVESLQVVGDLAWAQRLSSTPTVATKAFACASSAALTATERGMIPSLNLGRRRGSPRLVGRQGEEEEVMAACAWTGSPPASAP